MVAIFYCVSRTLFHGVDGDLCQPSSAIANPGWIDHYFKEETLYCFGFNGFAFASRKIFMEHNMEWYQHSLFNRSTTRKRESWIWCFCIPFSFYVLLNEELNALKFHRRQLKSSCLWLCLFSRCAFVMLVQSRFVVCSCQIKIHVQNIKSCSGYYYTSLS